MDLTTEAIRLGMNMARVRAEVASANIANVDVTGYRAQRADFGDAVGLLREAVSDPAIAESRFADMTPAALRSSVRPLDVGTDASESLDNQVAELETAGTNFQSLAKIMSQRFALMQLALAGRN